MAIRAKQLCAVTIGYDTYILPMTDGLKLVDIMGKAVPARRSYELWGAKFSINATPDPSRVRLELVTPDDIEIAADAEPTQLKHLALPKKSTQ